MINYLVGSSISGVTEWLLRTAPLNRYYPRGVNWLYDVQRFAGCRDMPVIVDVGANVGQTARGLLKFFPRSSIYCLEPVSETFRILKRDFGNSTRCFQTALGAQRSSATITLHEDSELNTMILDGHRASINTETIAVDTLDEFCRENGIASIDILKMDVQGWEMKVIDGASAMLPKTRFVLAEVGFIEAERDMQDFAPFNARMIGLGFKFCGFYEQFRYGDAKEIVGFANVLYMNRQAPL